MFPASTVTPTLQYLTQLLRTQIKSLVSALLFSIISIGFLCLLSSLLNSLLITSHLCKMSLDVFSTDRLPALRKLLKEWLKLLLQMVICHDAFNGSDTINVLESAFPAIV